MLQKNRDRDSEGEAFLAVLVLSSRWDTIEGAFSWMRSQAEVLIVCGN